MPATPNAAKEELAKAAAGYSPGPRQAQPVHYPEDMKRVYAASESGAMRDSITSKIDTTLVPYELTLMAAVALNYGAEKYAPRNFEKGFTIAQLCGSIERHNKSLMDGEEIDNESGLHHIAMLAASVAMLCHNFLQGRILIPDTPPKYGTPISDLARHASILLDQRNR